MAGPVGRFRQRGPATPPALMTAPPSIADAVTVWHAVGPTPEAAVPSYPTEPTLDIGDATTMTKDAPA